MAPQGPSNQYGSIPVIHNATTTTTNDDETISSDDEFDNCLPDETLRQTLLRQVHNFRIPYDAQRGYKATAFHLFQFERPHMRTFHASWICFFCSWFVWFSMSPLMPYIQASTGVTPQQIAQSNIWSMVGTIVLRLLLGPLCDQYGARRMLTGLLTICAIPLLFAGVFVHDYYSLLLVRFWTGCVGGTLVPAQYWITNMFVRQVCGRAMALCAGWGAMGGGFAQVVMGTLVFPTLQGWLKDDDLAWRVALVVPATVALGVAYFFQHYSDDCPLGNYSQLLRAGLLEEKSAVDSFRAGVVNVNAWILFVQFGATLGIELTMESCVTSHLAYRFDLPLAHAAACASLFGTMNIFSRGLGGVLSDEFFKRYSLRGRLGIHMVLSTIEAILMLAFAQCENLTWALATMVAFGIVGQMAMGTCFGLVPYVDGPNTGTIAGIVGAGGNVGAVAFLFFVQSFGDIPAFRSMAACALIASLLTPFIVIKGYRGLLFGKERGSVLATLLVPAGDSGIQHT